MNHAPRICEYCKAEFSPTYKVTAKYWATRRFCSSDCARLGMAGEERERARVPVSGRFWEKVERRSSDECWPWSGSVNRAGYGVISVDGQHRPTHRIAWTLTHGDVPEDLVICHRCDNPPCCNPGHLFLGTRADNNRDRNNKGRDGDFAGERNPNAKLTDAEAQEIVALVAAGSSQSAAGAVYGVKQAHVSRLVRGIARS